MDPRYQVPAANLDRDGIPRFAISEEFASALQWMLRIGAVVSAMSLLSSWMQLELLSRSFTGEEGLANDQRERASSVS